MSDRFVLYGTPHSQFTYKVALMLALCGAKFSFRYTSFRAGAHRKPAFRVLSRFGQVPVLQHGGRALVQAGAILEHLSEVLGRFGGKDAPARLDIREWLFWDTDRLAPPIYHSYGMKLGAMGLIPLNGDPVLLAHHHARAATALAILDRILEGRIYLVGDALTIADIACYADVAFARRSDIDIGAWASVARWAARIETRPQIRRPMEMLPTSDAEFD